VFKIGTIDVYFTKRLNMIAFLFIVLAVVLIIGTALILLRTAKTPKIPDSVKVQPYEDEDDGWGERFCVSTKSSR
jgi:NADH:ubiquinone oxidoreductase subunit 3 (subunit A)